MHFLAKKGLANLFFKKKLKQKRSCLTEPEIRLCQVILYGHGAIAKILRFVSPSKAANSPQNAVFRLKTPISPPQHNHSQFATIRPSLTEPAQIPQPTYSQNAVNPQLCKKIRFDLTEPCFLRQNSRKQQSLSWDYQNQKRLSALCASARFCGTREPLYRRLRP